MRLSADRNSPYYNRRLIGQVAVYLDGLICTNVWEFDEEGGFVEYMVLDDHGKPIRRPTRVGEPPHPLVFQTARRYGRVNVVVLPPRHDAHTSPPPLFAEWANPSGDTDGE